MLFFILFILVSECKKRWNQLRDAYRKALKNRETRSGQGNISIKKWKYEEIMSFLAPYFAERNQKSNLYTEESQDSVNNISIDTENLDPSSDGNTPFSPTSVSSLRSPSPPPGCSVSPSISTTSQQSKTKTPSKQIKPLSHVLHEYLGERKKLKVENKTDHLKKFFESMEETVRTFPPVFQIEVKNKIFKVVSEYEYKTLLRSENRSETRQQSDFQQRVLHSATFENVQPPSSQQSVSQWRSPEYMNEVFQSNSYQSPLQSPENLSTNLGPNQQFEERSYDCLI